MQKTIIFCAVIVFATVIFISGLIAAVKLNKNGDDDLSFILIVFLPLILFGFIGSILCILQG